MYVDSGHPVYNPEHVYDKMEFNYKSSLVREKQGPDDSKSKRMKVLKDADGDDMKFWHRDIHFRELASNYDTFCAMLIEIACMPQFLGNMADVAKAEGALFDNVTFFGPSSGFGARPLQSEEPVPRCDPKGFGDSVVEASQVEIIAHNLHFPRCPLQGDLLKTSAGKNAAGCKIPKCRAYILGDSEQLEPIAEIDANTVLGPCVQLRAFQDSGIGTISALVPLPVTVPGYLKDTNVWVHLTSGTNILAHIVNLDLLVKQELDAQDTASDGGTIKSSSSLPDFGDEADSVHSGPESLAPSSAAAPSLANSALSDFNKMLGGAKVLAPSGTSNNPLEGVWDDEVVAETPAAADEAEFQAKLNIAAEQAKQAAVDEATRQATAQMQAILKQTSDDHLAELARKQKEAKASSRWGRHLADPPSELPPRPPAPPIPKSFTDVPAHLPRMDIPAAPERDLSKRIPSPPPAPPVPQPPKNPPPPPPRSRAKVLAEGRKAENRADHLTPSWKKQQRAPIIEENVEELFRNVDVTAAPVTPPEILAPIDVSDALGTAPGTPELPTGSSSASAGPMVQPRLLEGFSSKSRRIRHLQLRPHHVLLLLSRHLLWTFCVLESGLKSHLKRMLNLSQMPLMFLV